MKIPLKTQNCVIFIVIFIWCSVKHPEFQTATGLATVQNVLKNTISNAKLTVIVIIPIFSTIIPIYEIILISNLYTAGNAKA